eukprot:4167700-Pleurochrysis_carterae.AAC.1
MLDPLCHTSLFSKSGHTLCVIDIYCRFTSRVHLHRSGRRFAASRRPLLHQRSRSVTFSWSPCYRRAASASASPAAIGGGVTLLADRREHRPALLKLGERQQLRRRSAQRVWPLRRAKGGARRRAAAAQVQAADIHVVGGDSACARAAGGGGDGARRQVALHAHARALPARAGHR